MTWLFRLLFFVLVFFLIQKVVAYIFRGGRTSNRRKTATRRSSGTKAIEGQMVKDPQCGMYVASSLALSMGSGDERVYFCSENCKDAYLREKVTREHSPS